jgi:hypothetical protein
MEEDENHNLANVWTKLLQGMEPENNFKGSETSNFHANIKRAGDDVSKGVAEQRLDDDDRDPGYQILSQEEIAESVLQGKEEDDDVIEEESASSCPKLSVIRNHMDNIILYIGASSDPEVLAYVDILGSFGQLLLRKQHGSGRQLKTDSFFLPTHLQQPSAIKLCQCFQFVDFIRNKEQSI